MMPDTYDGLVRLMQGVGFPVAVAAFVLIRLDKAMRDLTREVHDLLVFLKTRP